MSGRRSAPPGTRARGRTKTDGASEPRPEGTYTAGVPLLVITGLSGAGKSTAMRVFEDLGCYCVDNLPPSLIPAFFDLWKQQSAVGGGGVVVASDVRSGALFDDFRDTVDTLEESGIRFEILYLDATTHVLINRFNEVRRSHPLQAGRSLREAIEEERRRLRPIREIAGQIVDTSDLDAPALREVIVAGLPGADPERAVRLSFVSFGFKYGVPQDADYVFDVRFLPNPFYVPELRPRTGEDDEVYRYVMSREGADDFHHNMVELLAPTLESFVRVGKLSITVAVGCTGGRHRSVAFARRLAEHFSNSGWRSVCRHRDAGRLQG